MNQSNDRQQRSRSRATFDEGPSRKAREGRSSEREQRSVRRNSASSLQRRSTARRGHQELPLSSVVIGGLVVLLGLLLAIWLIATLMRGCSAGSTLQADNSPLTSENSQSVAEGQAETSEASSTTPQAATKTLSLGTTASSANSSTAADSTSTRVSLIAAGDNVIGNYLMQMADAQGGSPGDGSYDFSCLYDNVKSTLAGYDIAFVSQETVLGGSALEYAGYPSYNTPESVANALADAGFNVVNINTNHSFDRGEEGIKQAQKTWSSFSNLLTIGSYESQADRETVRVVEANGIRIAFLSYCYGQEAVSASEMPNDYYSVGFDEAALKEDIARAKSVADAVCVYMHWGTEYEGEITSQQTQLAQLCANEGVDVLIGSHPHVVQPVEWIASQDGKSMLCAYSIGDFVAAGAFGQNALVSGLLSLEFVREPGNSAVTVQKVVWHPILEHWENGKDTVYLAKDYTGEQAATNVLLGGLGIDWVHEQAVARIGSDIEIDLPVLTAPEDYTSYSADEEEYVAEEEYTDEGYTNEDEGVTSTEDVSAEEEGEAG